MYNLPDKHDEITPIWMPSPGVPIASRILAYLFAALMVIAIIRDQLIDRPIDIIFPKVESDWEYYKSNLNITFPYPKNWIFEESANPDGSKGASIQYPANVPVQFQIEQNSTPEILTTEQYNNVVDQLTTNISSATQYQQLGTENIGNNIVLYKFSCKISKRIVQGAYCVLTYPGKMCVLIGFSPDKNWNDMQKLMTIMIKKSRG